MNAFGGIVPGRIRVINAVDEHHGEIAVRGDRPHVAGEAPMNFIPDEGVGLFVESSPEHELVKTLHGGQRKQRILEPSGPVVVAKIEAERKLAAGGQARTLIIAALNPNAAVHLETGVILGPDPFHGGGPFPGQAVLGGVMVITGTDSLPGSIGVGSTVDPQDSIRAIEMVCGSDDREHRQRSQRWRQAEQVSVRDGL